MADLSLRPTRLVTSLLTHLGRQLRAMASTDFGESPLSPSGSFDPRFEEFISYLRMVGAVVGAFATLLIFNIASVVPILVLIMFAMSYSLMIVALAHRNSRLLYRGYLPFSLDVVTIAAGVAVTGGIQSEFYVCFYVTGVLYAVRFGYRQIIVLSISVAASYFVAIYLSEGRVFKEHLLLAAFRSVWLGILGFGAAFVGNVIRSTSDALAHELRRTRALLQAAHAPATSLTVDGVLAAVLDQSRLLTEADVAALQLYGGFGAPGVMREDVDDSAGAEAFRRLVHTHFQARKLLIDSGRPLAPRELAAKATHVPTALSEFSGLSCVTIPGEKGSLGFVAVARRDQPLTVTHQEALTAFLARASLAIQNARLYERVQTQLQELRATQSQLIRSERLAALGEMAAQVAHELNNPLASIQMYSSILQDQPEDEEEQRRLATAINEQGERARRVVRDILDFSRPQEPRPELLSLNTAVEHGLRLVWHTAELAEVTIAEDYSGRLPQVLVDKGQLTQVIVNLVLNAIHAMPQGGILTITTGIQDSEAYMRITDTGTGIAPEHVDRIFEPFFSTKPPSEGTGLGLAVCRGIIAKHHGRITVDSVLGEGSSFTVWLPLARTLMEETSGRRRHR